MKINRLWILGTLFSFLFFILIYQLYQIQIVNGLSYQDQYISSIKKNQSISGTRGRIYDRNGKLLAENQISYNLILEDVQRYKTTKEKNGTLNGIAWQMISLVHDEGKLNTSIPIEALEDDTYRYTESGFRLNRFKADLFGKSEIGDLSPKENNMTAQELIVYMCGEKKFLLGEDNSSLYTPEELELYGLPATLSKKDVLQILNIRYGLSLNSYRKYLPFQVASGISEDAMAAALEQKSRLPGIDVQTGTTRVYYGGESMSAILGYTGLISSEELAQYEDSEGYTSQSTIGKSGIEKSMEPWLRGKDGREEFYTDSLGFRRSKEQQILSPETGNDIYLTIDSDLQDTVYSLLEQQIAGILLANMVNVKRANMPETTEASQIRIPIDDVFAAMFKNHVIDTSRFSQDTASPEERAVFQTFERQKELVLADLSDSFSRNVGEDQELCAYYHILIKKVKESGWLAEKAKSWDPKEQSMEDYFKSAIENGSVSLETLKTDQTYMDLEHMLALLKEKSIETVKSNSEFDLLNYETMVRDGDLTGYTVLSLLYEQGVLSKEDGDYETLVSQAQTEWEFIRNKIRNLEITPAQLALDPCSGSAVVTDPQSGQVLACVSYPGYDNNRLANEIDQSYYQKLTKDLSLPMFNRATSQLTAPGSTFKPVTVAAGLNEGVITEETSIVCDGVFDQVEPSLRCWNRLGHGTIRGSAEALKNSCNDYLCEITYQIGKRANGTYSEEDGLSVLQKYASMFTLDQNTGIELGEAKPQVTDRYAIPSSIGQGTHNYTTTQIARYAAILANNGTSYELSLIQKIVKVDGTVEKDFTPKVVSQIDLPPSIWANLGLGMRNLAASNATLKTLDMESAGKTGTAEESKTRPNHGWFIGYAPYQNPKLALAVRISNGYSSGNVVSVGRDIFNYYFKLKEVDKLVTGKAANVANNVRTD